MFLAFYFLAFSVYGQSKKTNRPNLKGTTLTEYYVTVKLVDKEPKFKPTYLFATKLDPKQKKWNLDTNKINIDNYFLTKQNIHHVGYLEPDCACNLFGDTTGNGVIIVHLKPSLKLVTVKKFIEASKIPFNPLDKYEIYINYRSIINDNVFIDSDAEIHPIYKIAYTHRNGPLIGFEIRTWTVEQVLKYGM
jgi:hypothetical protein